VETAAGDLGLSEAEETRKRNTRTLGQVPTPGPVAALMARWVISTRPAAVLDPAAGLGALLHACRDASGTPQLVGVERDAGTLQQAMRAAPPGTKLILADYLFSESGMFQGIIANPPYVKSQRMEYSEADWRYFEERFGMRLDRLTNLYALFLLKIWEDLAPGGRAAVLLPAEFMNANFGRQIKERLLKDMCPAGMVVFAPKLNLFADALTTSAIVFLERGRAKDSPCPAIRAATLADAESFVEKLLHPKHTASLAGVHDLRQFDPAQKWLNGLLAEAPSAYTPALTQKVGDYFRCSRGIATGANDYFTLSPSMLREHRLTPDHVEHCITKATDAAGLVFTGEKLEALARADRRCLLLSPRSNGAGLNAYLRVGEERGIPQRHLPSHRPVWYLPENRTVAEILVAVFSRETVKFILNTSGAKNLTCFHGLYAREAKTNLSPLLTLFLNSSWGRVAFAQVNRFYGNGLNKLEPKDVEDMPCPPLPPQTPVQAKSLTRQLCELERLPDTLRYEAIDSLAGELLLLTAMPPPAFKAGAGEPAEPLPGPVKSRRRAVPRKHRGAPAS
jgi:adenine-specific DNA-methyltransferase